MAMHSDLMERILYIISDSKIEGTGFSKVLCQGRLFECGLAVDRRIGGYAGTLRLKYSPSIVPGRVLSSSSS